jgi:hypothetical protein
LSHIPCKIRYLFAPIFYIFHKIPFSLRVFFQVPQGAPFLFALLRTLRALEQSVEAGLPFLQESSVRCEDALTPGAFQKYELFRHPRDLPFQAIRPG